MTTHFGVRHVENVRGREQNVIQSACGKTIPHTPDVAFTHHWNIVNCAGCLNACKPYPFCYGNPSVSDCIMAGYCRKSPACND